VAQHPSKQRLLGAALAADVINRSSSRQPTRAVPPVPAGFPAVRRLAQVAARADASAAASVQAGVWGACGLDLRRLDDKQVRQQVLQPFEGRRSRRLRLLLRLGRLWLVLLLRLGRLWLVLLLWLGSLWLVLLLWGLPVAVTLVPATPAGPAAVSAARAPAPPLQRRLCGPSAPSPAAPAVAALPSTTPYMATATGPCATDPCCGCCLIAGRALQSGVAQLAVAASACPTAKG
jgi:hypothetical protein